MAETLSIPDQESVDMAREGQQAGEGPHTRGDSVKMNGVMDVVGRI